MVFKEWWVLITIPMIVGLMLFFRMKVRSASIRFSSTKLMMSAQPTIRLFIAKHLFSLRLAAIVLFLCAVARPRIPLHETTVETQGIDIVLALDSSGSMLAEDFTIGGRRYNRLDVVKNVVADFINGRDSDRIGMVTFAGRAYTVCPLTVDYDWLIQNLKRIEIGAIEDGTAVGSAISSSLNRLKDTKAKSKIIILLTDGVNNAGSIAPLTAAEAAKALGIKIYTIGAGSNGLVPYPVKDMFGRTGYQQVHIDLDEDVLKQIAQTTGGMYFHATDTESLRTIYKEIDAMETTPIEEKSFQEYNELFAVFLIAGLLLLLWEIILTHTIARQLP